MSLSGTTNTYLPPTLDGLNIIEADAIYINGIPIDTENLVPYTGASKNVNLGIFNFQTLGSISAKQHILPLFGSTIMTSPTTSSIFYADAWKLNNTVQISSLGGGSFLSTSYLHITDVSNTSTLLTLQSDGIADFANTKVRISTMATNEYDVVNLSTLTSAVAFIENVNALNYVPYNGATDNLNMGGSTITTTGLVNAGALRITSSVVNADYTLSVNTYDQLEFTNLSNGSIFKTNGSDLFVSGDITCTTLGATDVAASGSFYLAKASPAEWRTMLGMSDEYEIKDDAGVMRLRLSKTTGLTVSTMNITQVPSATPSLALGLNGGGQVVSFAVPTATNILPLANTFTNTNTFLSTLTAGVGYTTSINGALTTGLNDLGFTSASFTTAGITGAYTPPLGTITNPSGSTYQIAQTAQGRSIMAISGFTPSVGITYVFEFNINCTIGTATISVEQDNIMVSPALYPLSTGFNRVVGSFTYNGTPNTVVFKIYTGVASWNAQWDSFVLSTYTVGLNANMNCLTLNNRITQRYNALATDVSTLVNRATMDSAISAGSIVNLNNTFIGTNAFNNDVSLGVSTVVVNQQSITTSILQTAGISSQALGGTAVISGSYLLTPTPTTFPYASVYSPTQTFLANAKYNYLFTGFTAGIFGVSLTVYQANVGNTASIAISSTVPVVVGTFSGIFTPNINASYLGQVFFTFSGINNKTVGWTTFTYQRGMETVNGELTVNGNTILGTTTTGTTSTGNLTVRAGNTLTKVGGNSGANFFRLQGEDTGSSPYTEYHFNNLRRMYVGNATASDAIIASENSAQLTFATQGTNRMFIDTAGNVDVSSRELRISQLNGNCQIRMKDGSFNIASLLHQNGKVLYFLGTNIGDWTGGWTTYRPLEINLEGGGCAMQEGLFLRGGNLTLGAGAGSISCANQPFCIVGGVGGASVFYPVGAVFGAGSQLFAYTSAGMSNSGTSGWSAGAGAFFFTKTGKWQVNWSFYWNNFAGGSRAVLLHYNSAGALLETRYCALNGGGIGSDTTQAYSTLIYGAVGDFLQCQFQSGSGTLFFGGITHTHATFYFCS